MCTSIKMSDLLHFDTNLIILIIKALHNELCSALKLRFNLYYQTVRPALKLNYLIRVTVLKRTTSVLATVDIILIKISSATPTTSFLVSPIVSPVTAAL